MNFTSLWNCDTFDYLTHQSFTSCISIWINWTKLGWIFKCLLGKQISNTVTWFTQSERERRWEGGEVHTCTWNSIKAFPIHLFKQHIKTSKQNYWVNLVLPMLLHRMMTENSNSIFNILLCLWFAPNNRKFNFIPIGVKILTHFQCASNSITLSVDANANIHDPLENALQRKFRILFETIFRIRYAKFVYN